MFGRHLVDESGPGGNVLLVRELGGLTGSLLHEHLLEARLQQNLHVLRGDGNTLLLRENFLHGTHGELLVLQRAGSEQPHGERGGPQQGPLKCRAPCGAAPGSGAEEGASDHGKRIRKCRREGSGSSAIKKKEYRINKTFGRRCTLASARLTPA